MKFYRVSYKLEDGEKNHYAPSRGKAKKFIQYLEAEGASKLEYIKESAQIHDEKWANKQGALDYLNKLEE
jgi:hypothetical protein